MPVQIFLTRGKLALLLGLIFINIIVFGFVNPFSSAALVVFIGFLVAGADFICLTLVLLKLLGLLWPKIKPHRHRVAIFLGSFELIILALATLGQLSWRDFIGVIALWVIGYAYLIYFGQSLKANTKR